MTTSSRKDALRHEVYGRQPGTGNNMQGNELRNLLTVRLHSYSISVTSKGRSSLRPRSSTARTR